MDWNHRFVGRVRLSAASCRLPAGFLGVDGLFSIGFSDLSG